MWLHNVATAKCQGSMVSEVSLESLIITMWLINKVKKRGTDAMEDEGHPTRLQQVNLVQCNFV